jgi:hypothetical protein
VLVALAVPWFLWGSGRVVAGLPVWVWWHIGLMGLARGRSTPSPEPAGTPGWRPGVRPTGEATRQVGIIVAYLALTLGVGPVAYRLTDRTAEDYFLASRTLGTVVLLFTTFATLLSASTLLAGPTVAFANGSGWLLVMGLMDGVICGSLVRHRLQAVAGRSPPSE